MWLNLQVLPLCPDPQPNSRCVRAPPPHWVWRAFQSCQVLILTAPQHRPARWPLVLPLLARHVGVAQQMAPPAVDGAVQQPATAFRPAEEQLWYLHPTGPAGDLPYRARLCWSLRPGLLCPLDPHHGPPLAQTQTMNPDTHSREEPRGGQSLDSKRVTHWSICGLTGCWCTVITFWNNGRASFRYAQNKW